MLDGVFCLAFGRNFKSKSMKSLQINSVFPPNKTLAENICLSEQKLGRCFVIVSQLDSTDYHKWLRYIKTLVFPRELVYDSCIIGPIIHEHFWLCSLEEPGEMPKTVCVQLVLLQAYHTSIAVHYCAPANSEVLVVYRPMVEERLFYFHSKDLPTIYCSAACLRSDTNMVKL